MTQLARVGVSAEAWQAFRQLALRRGLSVTAYLGRLVEQELRRHSRIALAETTTDAPPRDEAIAALKDVRRSIDEFDDVAGRLAVRPSHTEEPGPMSAPASGSLPTSLSEPTGVRAPDQLPSLTGSRSVVDTQAASR